MTFDDFIKKYDGKKVEAGGSPNAKYQCVDLANQYLTECLEQPAVFGANAQDFPSRIGSKYEYILNTPSGVPDKGCLVIWKSKDNVGHIAIFVDGNSTKFNSFDQNFPVGSPCHIQSHSYTNVLGWLKFKGGELEACLHLLHEVVIPEKEGLEREYRESREIAAKEIKSRDDHIADLEQKIKSSETDRDETEKIMKELNEEDYQRVQSLAQKLMPKRTDWPAIIAEIEGLINVEDQKRAIEKELSVAKEENKGYQVRVEELDRRLGALQESTTHKPTASLSNKILTFLKGVIKYGKNS